MVVKDDVKAYSCPFCNGRNLKIDQRRFRCVRYDDGERQDRYVVTVRCNKCHARGPTTSVWLKCSHGGNATEVLREKAVMAWNRQVQVNDCRNELCLLCGKYKTAHRGSCDGCRWHVLENSEVS